MTRKSDIKSSKAAKKETKKVLSSKRILSSEELTSVAFDAEDVLDIVDVIAEVVAEKSDVEIGDVDFTENGIVVEVEGDPVEIILIDDEGEVEVDDDVDSSKEDKKACSSREVFSSRRSKRTEKRA